MNTRTDLNTLTLKAYYQVMCSPAKPAMFTQCLKLLKCVKYLKKMQSGKEFSYTHDWYQNI